MLSIGVWGIAGVGLGLVLGFAGQIALCQAAFVGVGAYTYAILTMKLDFPPLLSLLAGVIISTALAALVSPILRIRGYYLVIATIVLNLLLSALAVSSLGVPGGSSGMAGVPYLSLFGLELKSIEGYAILSVALLVAFTVGATLFYARGRRWRIIQALRHDEGLAAGLGFNVVGVKRELFMVSGGAAGLAGGILASAYGFISPGQFSFAESFTLALAVFIGGSLNLWGAVLGVALLELTAPLLGDAQALHGLLVGIVALITVRFAPDGWIKRRPDDFASQFARATELSRKKAAALGGPIPPAAIQGSEVDLIGLGKSFGSLQAVSGVSLRIAPGRILGLIGPNGAGKTTLLNLIAGEIPVSSGTIRVDQQDVTYLSPFRRARLGLRRTYQQSRIITDLSVLDNILLGVDAPGELRNSTAGKDELIAAAIRAADEAGASLLLEKPTGTLTFGERRLVELARLLFSQPKLALLDEPLSGLSNTEGEWLSKVIRTLSERGTTVVLVEHAIPFVMSLVDELVVLHQGSVLAAGDPNEVVSLESVRESYLGSVLEEESA